MNQFTAKSRITVGLASLLVSVLCVAMMIGLVPERKSAILEGRAALCETIAVSASDYISRDEPGRLEFLLQSVVKRNDDVLSAGVRKISGQLLSDVGEHAAAWERRSGDRSTDAFVLVPIRHGPEKWGSVELQFRPVERQGIIAKWIMDPWLRLVAFVTAACFLLFNYYLKKMLEHLDPSQTVPKRVRSALDMLAEGLLVTDRKGRVVLANDAFSKWSGKDPESLVGRVASEFPFSLASVDGDSRLPWERAIEDKIPQASFLLKLQDSCHAELTLIANSSPVLGHDGDYRGVLTSFEDVSELEEHKTELAKAKTEADIANQAKSEFLAHMSHEIRTPMNAILGYTEVLRRGFDTSIEDRQKYLQTIHASGEHLLALINDILDLSKIEAGRMELEMVRVSPHELVSQSLSVFHIKAQEKGIDLGFECHGKLPETILTDAVRLRQAIINLVGNAIKFTETGGVKVIVRFIALARDPLLSISIADTGIGMSEEALKNIFTPFSQADATITRRFGGTGLGLAICRQLSEAMGGEVTVESELGVGSIFTLTIGTGPLDGVKLVDPKMLDSISASAAQDQRKQNQTLPPAHILVVDDGDSNRDLLSLLLRRFGCTVDMAVNGQIAVDKVTSGEYDLVLMDMQMPVMDGYTASTLLRERGYTLPIIALTAHAMHGDEAKCREAGCTGFLTKPIKMDHLHTTLSEILGSGADESSTRVTQTSTKSTVSESRSEPSPELNSKQPRIVERSPTHPFEPDCEESEFSEKSLPNVSEPIQDMPLICTLPLDDPEFLVIAEKFVVRLRDQIDAMRIALNQSDFAELRELGHWLKGAGGSVGFNAFTEPAQMLEELALEQQEQGIKKSIEVIESLAQRIVLPAATEPTQV